MTSWGDRARRALLWEPLEDPIERRVRAVLVVLLVALLAHVAFGDNPWQDGIAERLRDGEPVRAVDYAATYGWWMAAVNALAVVALLATRRHWLRRGDAPLNPALAAPGSGDRIWFVPLVAGAVVATAVLAAPRLSHSLWGDEEWTVRRAIDGRYERRESGEIEHRQVGWRETFFDYRKPSNHQGFTVLSRFSLSLWRSLARPELHFVSEPAVRMPAYLAGLGAVATLALLLRRLGWPLAGVFAAWTLVLHPWILRYVSEARGYALLVLLVPLSILLLLRALERGTWGRWAAYGAAQVWMLWTWPPTGFVVVALNAAALGGLLTLYRGRPEARTQWTRWALVSGAGALVFLQLMLSSLVLLATYVERETLLMGASWLANLGSHLVSGVAWGPDRDAYRELIEVARAWPTAFWVWVGASAALVAAGVVRLLVGDRIRALVAAVLLLPGPLLWLWAWGQDTFLYHWFLLFMVPSLAAFLGIGIASLAGALPGRISAPAAALAMVGWLAAFAAITNPARSALRAGSLQPMRESVALTRPNRDPLAPENDRILTASIQREPDYYDPRVILVETPRELRQLMRRADREELALFVNYGRPELARKRVPELVELVGREHLFEEIAVLRGFEPRGVRHVLRYRGRLAGSTPSEPGESAGKSAP